MIQDLQQFDGVEFRNIVVHKLYVNKCRCTISSGQTIRPSNRPTKATNRSSLLEHKNNKLYSTKCMSCIHQQDKVIHFIYQKTLYFCLISEIYLYVNTQISCFYKTPMQVQIFSLVNKNNKKTRNIITLT